ncbi:hypothetical protein Drorol1_Dr00003226 [Drosera rotundifolia]
MSIEPIILSYLTRRTIGWVPLLCHQGCRIRLLWSQIYNHLIRPLTAKQINDISNNTIVRDNNHLKEATAIDHIATIAIFMEMSGTHVGFYTDIHPDINSVQIDNIMQRQMNSPMSALASEQYQKLLKLLGNNSSKLTANFANAETSLAVSVNHSSL